ncbi:MAG: PaaI family thioesterase [Betaproteobacteria bacterium]|jgi:acyl-coenzyme A thioesterase PaaI-like protein
MSELTIPEGFYQHPMSEKAEKFLSLLGPWYFKNAVHENGRAERVFGIHIEDKHTNIWGSAHGGMLISMADSALGYNLSRATDPPQKLVTVHLNADFIASPKPGDWVHTEMNIHKIGAKMSFADCYLKVGEKLILRTSGVFAVLQRLQKVSA